MESDIKKIHSNIIEQENENSEDDNHINDNEEDVCDNDEKEE